MPTYEYRCNACEEELEVQQRITEPALTDCPKCGKPALERLISATSFHLKGGGWYRDLYSTNKPGSSTGTDKDRTDRLQKAVDADKKPAAASDSSSSTASPSSATTTSSSSSPTAKPAA